MERDQLTRQCTAFRTFNELINAPGNYRPSLRRDMPGALRLADYYDTAQQERGDARRAHVS